MQGKNKMVLTDKQKERLVKQFCNGNKEALYKFLKGTTDDTILRRKRGENPVCR